MKLKVKEIVLFAVLGTVMFVSKLIMEFLPNVHLVAMFIVVFTVVYRQKALYPLTVFIFLCGVQQGFSLWWVPYIYVWHILWAAVMLLPKKMNPHAATVVYMIVSGLHGFLFGILYSPMQALMFGLSFEETVAWIAVGFPFDAIHGVSNIVASLLTVPLIKILKKIG